MQAPVHLPNRLAEKNEMFFTEQSFFSFHAGHVSMLQSPSNCHLSSCSLASDWNWRGMMIPLPEDADISNKQSVIKDATRKVEGENGSGTS